ncbi:MAG: NUDIX domain-containing protein [Bacteroidales bacterium]
MSYTYKYPRPCVTVDIALFRPAQAEYEILLIQRLHPPFEGYWALPGGFIEMNETLLASALRELEEETGIHDIELTQFRTYGDPGRDPRCRTITIVYYGFVEENTTAHAGDDANNASWFRLNQLPQLAFDHQSILNDLINHLKTINLISNSL